MNDATSNMINYTVRSYTTLKLVCPQDEIVFHQKQGLPIKTINPEFHDYIR
jgi:hypothetical protein